MVVVANLPRGECGDDDKIIISTETKLSIAMPLAFVHVVLSLRRPFIEQGRVVE